MVDREYIRKTALPGRLVHPEDFPAVGNVPQDGPQVVRRVSEPHLYPQEAPPRPVTGPYLEVIRAWLVEDLQAPRKQRHTARRVYDRLVAERGFKGSESIVRKIVAEIKKEIAPKKGFLPLEAAPGEQAQVDWGEAVVRLGGEERRVHLFCMRLRHSGTPFVYALPDEGLEAFLRGTVWPSSSSAESPRSAFTTTSNRR